MRAWSSASSHSAAISPSNSCSPRAATTLLRMSSAVSGVAPWSASHDATWARSAWHISATTSPSAAPGTRAWRPPSSVS